jgi:acyl carrier protein
MTHEVTQQVAPGRREVVEMLASYGARDAATIGEGIDSLELAWLIHAVEQRYLLTLELDDDQLTRMSTVDGAVEALREVLGDGH